MRLGWPSLRLCSSAWTARAMHATRCALRARRIVMRTSGACLRGTRIRRSGGAGGREFPRIRIRPKTRPALLRPSELIFLNYREDRQDQAPHRRRARRPASSAGTRSGWPAGELGRGGRHAAARLRGAPRNRMCRGARAVTRSALGTVPSCGATQTRQRTPISAREGMPRRCPPLRRPLASDVSADLLAPRPPGARSRGAQGRSRERPAGSLPPASCQPLSAARR